MQLYSAKGRSPLAGVERAYDVILSCIGWKPHLGKDCFTLLEAVQNSTLIMTNLRLIIIRLYLQSVIKAIIFLTLCERTGHFSDYAVATISLSPYLLILVLNEDTNLQSWQPVVS